MRKGKQVGGAGVHLQLQNKEVRRRNMPAVKARIPH